MLVSLGRGTYPEDRVKVCTRTDCEPQEPTVRPPSRIRTYAPPPPNLQKSVTITIYILSTIYESVHERTQPEAAEKR